MGYQPSGRRSAKSYTLLPYKVAAADACLLRPPEAPNAAGRAFRLKQYVVPDTYLVLRKKNTKKNEHQKPKRARLIFTGKQQNWYLVCFYVVLGLELTFS